jgi:hypothetical protein
MKIKNIKVFLTLCIISLLSVFVCSSATMVKAETSTIPSTTISTSEGAGEGEDLGGESGDAGEETEDPEVTVPTFDGFAITTGVIMDEYLYSALLDLYSNYFKGITGQAYTGTTIYSDMLKDFTTINLDKKNISNLQGIEKLDFDKLQSFSANSNAITEFSSSLLENVEEWTLTSLSLADNELKNVDLSGLTGLVDINLSSNKLTTVDLTSIEGRVAGSTFTLNIANNAFKSFSDIKLPTKRISHYNVNILNNNITSIADTYFTDNYTLNIGIQGFNVADTKPATDTAKNLVVYKTNIDGLSIKVYKVDGEVDELISTITDADIIDGNSIRLDLKVGQYKFVYQIDGEDAYTKEYTNKLYLKYSEFSVVPQNLKCIFVYKNKEYTELGKVTGKVTVKLSSYDEGAKIFYQVNNGDWVEGTVIECGDGGNYTIKVKAVVDGVESLEQSVWVRTSLNLYIPDALMLALVLLLALVLFLVVLPIVSKKYFKKD